VRSARVPAPLLAACLGLLLALPAAATGAASAVPAAAPAAGTQASAAERVAHRVLANGLEVFVVSDHAVPLATVCVVFRGGAVAQDAKDAGLFHLYEHMMFDGNEKYPSQAAFNAALNRLGAASWNGSTGEDSISYYITVPSERLSEGLAFWSWAVKKPVFNEAKLQLEKQVVINEIGGIQADPGSIFENALTSRLFPAAPWRKNVDGPVSNISGATIAQLEAIRRSYYIPRNAALMIGGDVESGEAFALAARWFGDWQGGPAPVIAEPPQAPIPAGVSIVYPDQSFNKGIAQVQFRWSGPDVARQTADTYVADILMSLLSSASGRFKTGLMKRVADLVGPEYLYFDYPTSKDGSTIDFSAILRLGDPGTDGSLALRAEGLRSALSEELALVAADPAAYFPAGALERAKTKLIDRNILAMEDGGRFVTNTLGFWWAVAGTDYFFGYQDNCLKVGWLEISRFIGRYFLGSHEAAALRAESSYLAANDAAHAVAGAPAAGGAPAYERVGADKAYWWQR
jgi:zinc protease